jgi:predicted PurR-regulated permease PerM
LERLEAWIDQHRWGVRFWNRMPADAPQIPTDQIVAHLSAAILGTFNGLGSLVLVLFLGLLFAIQPQLYFGGFLKLVPPAHRTRTRGVFYQVAWVLKWWLIARMISMVTIGILTWGGLLLMGVDYALTLAIIAAVFTFIPYFGPILALAPALLAGLAQSNATAAWVFLLYMAIQVLETYLITPLVEYQAASLPPALSIVVQLSLAILTGPIGFIFADPLLAAGMVLVRAFYVEDVLKDENAGEPEPI